MRIVARYNLAITADCHVHQEKSSTVVMLMANHNSELTDCAECEIEERRATCCVANARPTKPRPYVDRTRRHISANYLYHSATNPDRYPVNRDAGSLPLTGKLRRICGRRHSPRSIAYAHSRRLLRNQIEFSSAAATWSLHSRRARSAPLSTWPSSRFAHLHRRPRGCAKLASLHFYVSDLGGPLCQRQKYEAHPSRKHCWVGDTDGWSATLTGQDG